MAKKTKKSLTINSKETRVFLGLILLVLGAAFVVAPFAPTAKALSIPLQYFGKSSIFWGIAIIVLSLRLMTSFTYLQPKIRIFGYFFVAVVASTLFAFWVPTEKLNDLLIQQSYGGTVGLFFHKGLKDLVGKFIEFLILLVFSIVAFSIISGTSMEKIGNSFERILSAIAGIFNRKKDMGMIDDQTEDRDRLGFLKKPFVGSGNDEIDGLEAIIQTTESPSGDDSESDTQEDIAENPIPEDPFGKESTQVIDRSSPSPNKGADSAMETALIIKDDQFSDWVSPPLSILQKPIVQKQDQEIHKRNAVLIERTLMSFDIESKVTKITIGPTVVQYAISITVGTKVSKVKNLTNDLALALATSESLIRIETPIPGTSLIGIEIPNPTPNFVYIRDIVTEIRDNPDRYHLPLALGKDVAGKIYIKDLVNMPHLLVAGATGTGKSVGVNSILTGLLMTKTPSELRLILVDPKMVEMAPYNDLPHLITPVITDMELVVNALDWAIQEMLRRYRILKQVGTKNIIEYNRKSPDAKMPYIVIVVDEMSDLMQSTGADVDSKILRLAQMARAIGIHLILATQRPDVKVITGVIKANINGRMAFSVSQGVDSRVILDQSGAENLIGRGDMLFKSPDATKAVRLQGAFTTTEDTEHIVDFIIQQSKGRETTKIEAVTNPEPDLTSIGTSGGIKSLSDDDLFEQALEQVVVTQKGSSSMLQRKFSIGYNRAARLIDELEKFGVVGPQVGSNPRDVLVRTKDEFIAKLHQQAQQNDQQSVPDELYDE